MSYFERLNLGELAIASITSAYECSVAAIHQLASQSGWPHGPYLPFTKSKVYLVFFEPEGRVHLSLCEYCWHRRYAEKLLVEQFLERHGLGPELTRFLGETVAPAKTRYAPL